jgi:hypothetical protein
VRNKPRIRRTEIIEWDLTNPYILHYLNTGEMIVPCRYLTFEELEQMRETE